jgi:predicted DNA-binding antitoxin AbrB/MazE fold protein
MRKLQAVYEGGVLRPIEALPFEEHQLVSVVVLDEAPSDAEIGFESAQSFEPLADRSVDRNTVRAALSKIPGSLDADFTAARDER